ncbi:MAG: beta-ketoacyl-ACP synthase III [Thermodesulfobacteriota bacterium]
MRAIITAVGHYVPQKKLTNKDLEQMVDTNDEWIRTRTGIRERRILDKDKGTSYMAVEAAKMALRQKNISAAEIDLIIVATTTPDMTVPPTAAFVQKELGAVNCWGYDINGACSGFVFALATGAQFIESGRHRKVLVIGADKMSSIIDYQDRNTCILFGDAGGAVLLEPSEEKDLGITDFILHLDGSGSNYLRIAAGGSLLPTTPETVANKMHYLYQDGKTVFKFAVNGMTDVVEKLLENNHLSGDDIRLFIPHQANFRIIDAVAKKIDLRSDQVMLNIEKYGNTTAATIPLAMSEAYQQRLMQKGDWIVIAAFGAGFTWGSLLLKWAMD